MTSQNQKQEFIGGLITSALAKKGVELVVEKALKKAAEKPTTKMVESDVPKATPVVVDKLKEEVQSRAEHQLDAEDHWRSRNIWGSIVGLITAAETLRIFWTDGQVQTVQEYLVPIGILVSALTPLYSRFIAKKPLFK